MNTLKLELQAEDRLSDVGNDDDVGRHMQRLNKILLVAGGALAMLYLLTLPRPSNLFGNVASFPLAFMLLAFVPAAYAVYLAFMPHWRRVPMALRRPVIARCLSLSLLTLALLPLHDVLEGSPNVAFVFLFFLGGVALLQVWQRRGDGGNEDEELFP